MTKVTSLPDNVEFDVAANETLLDPAIRSDFAFAHACGGRAKCSACRVWVLDGLEACPERTELEASMAARIALTPGKYGSPVSSGGKTSVSQFRP